MLNKLTKTQVAANARKIVKECGGPSAVGKHFSIKPWAVSKWLAAGRVPADRIKPLCEIANGQRVRCGSAGYWQPCMFLEG